MKPINLKLTVEEITLLASLAADQLFRREFIDPRMPGYRAKPGEVALGKALVTRLRSLINDGPRHAGSPPTVASTYAWDSPTKRPTRIPNAV